MRAFVGGALVGVFVFVFAFDLLCFLLIRSIQGEQKKRPVQMGKETSGWHKKLTLQEKQERAERRREMAPTLETLTNEQDIQAWCLRHRKTQRATDHMLHRLRLRHPLPRDARDLRTVPMPDRVPRSFEDVDRTPPRFWELDFYHHEI